MRNMSFFLTISQMKNKTKTVTRRLSWNFLKTGDVVQAVEKCQGLKTGEKIKPICKIKIKSVSEEVLKDIQPLDIDREGFTGMPKNTFIDIFCKTNKCTPDSVVNRIEFEFLEE